MSNKSLLKFLYIVVLAYAIRVHITASMWVSLSSTFFTRVFTRVYQPAMQSPLNGSYVYLPIVGIIKKLLSFKKSEILIATFLWLLFDLFVVGWFFKGVGHYTQSASFYPC